MPVAVSKMDYYDILELEKGATEEEIRVAYKKLVRWRAFEVSGSVADTRLNTPRR